MSGYDTDLDAIARTAITTRPSSRTRARHLRNVDNSGECFTARFRETLAGLTVKSAPKVREHDRGLAPESCEETRLP